MNEQATNMIHQILIKAIETVDSATTFATQQVPLVVEQLLLYTLWYSLVISFIGILIILSPLVVNRYTKRLWLAEKERRGDMYSSTSDFQDFLVGGSIVYTVVSLLVGIILIFKYIEWLMILLAPKLFLLEYASSLLK